MSSLPFGNLPPFQPRRFLPAANLNVGDWSQVAPFFGRLESRAPQCATAVDLEAWLFDWSELGTAISEELSRRYVAMTCHMDDAQAKQDYLDFVEQVLPQVETRQFRLAQLFQSHPLRPVLPKQRYEVFDSATAATVELFREENVAIETAEAKLTPDFDAVTGAMTVHFRGEERTLQEMWKYLQEPNRLTRQEAWELSYNRALADADKLDTIFESLLQHRERMAANASFKNYRDYAWRRLRRFDYTPDQCIEFHSAIESEVLPVVCELQLQRLKNLGLDTLRPWDTEVDSDGHTPLRPFTEIPELVARTQCILGRLDGELASGFQRLQDLQLLDLENRKNKMPGGYQVSLSESGMPFILLNATGVHMDVVTLLHESGHAFHTLEARAQPLLAWREASMLDKQAADLVAKAKELREQAIGHARQKFVKEHGAPIHYAETFDLPTPEDLPKDQAGAAQFLLNKMNSGELMPTETGAWGDLTLPFPLQPQAGSSGWSKSGSADWLNEHLGKGAA
jgi:oligoendopeptidase F